MQRVIFIFIISTLTLFAQLSAPGVEQIFGGRIVGITGYATSSNTSRIFITTESANSAFYADVSYSSSSATITRFTVFPSMDDSKNLGAGINKVDAHDLSGRLFFIYNGYVYSSGVADTSITKVADIMASDFVIENNTLLILSGSNMFFGTLDASGSFIPSTGAPKSVPLTGGMTRIAINPSNRLVYIFQEGTTPTLAKSTNDFDSLDTAVFTNLGVPSLYPADMWKGFGISPSGRLFLGGHDADSKIIAYSDDEATYFSYDSFIAGVSSPVFDFSIAGTDTMVYYAAMYSTNHGNSWTNFGNLGQETHPNDGAVFADPATSNDSLVYLTTDEGIGMSVNSGRRIYEINTGIEAVQVADIDMTSDKKTAWIASKSGVRKVTNYTTSPIWTNALFPQDDGSPYFSAEMRAGDTNTVYVGNVRVKKTTDGGGSWSQVFTAEASPYNLGAGTFIDAIEVCDFAPSIVMAGYNSPFSDKGGLFVSTDDGANWSQILISASTSGQDVDVTDILFINEGSDTVAYVSAEYPNGYSVYKVKKSGSSWSVSQDMSSAHTSTGTAIVVTINDLEKSSTADTLFASGTDAGTNHPVVYYKAFSGTNKWTPLPVSGFPFSTGKRATAVTYGIDTLYVAVDADIYYLPKGSASWTLGYSYPVGTMINFIFYDDLLVGTGTGLYGHHGLKPNSNAGGKNTPVNFALSQNYPNPFNPSTTITYALSQESKVSLKVFSMLGEEVATLVNAQQIAGSYTVRFDATSLPSGVYIYTLTAGSFSQTKKMMLLK